MSIDALLEQKNPPSFALIRESECIGCTKCIQACPVDAIIGSVKLMHTVISNACIGCELCVPPCPVDCIDILPRPAEFQKNAAFIQQAQSRALKRVTRQSREQPPLLECPSVSERQLAIQQAVQRARQKRHNQLPATHE